MTDGERPEDGGAIQDCSLPWNQVAALWMSTSSSRAIRGGVHPLARSLLLGACLFGPLPSDHGQDVYKIFLKLLSL